MYADDVVIFLPAILALLFPSFSIQKFLTQTATTDAGSIQSRYGYKQAKDIALLHSLQSEMICHMSGRPTVTYCTNTQAGLAPEAD